MSTKDIRELSAQLKDIAKDLSFLGHPRYPVKQLNELFPQHKVFIAELEDISVPFAVDEDLKKKSIDRFLINMERMDISKELKNIFTRRIEDYQILLSMMHNFNTPLFYKHCTTLYSSSFMSEKRATFLKFLDRIPEFCTPDVGEKVYQGEEARNYLKSKMLETFSGEDFEVKASTSLLSDSSAGRRTLKLNPFKSYSEQQLDLFLVHEGWVHLGTSINGSAQDEHSWLSTWAPRTTFLQEGLAVLVELITGNMTAERWNKVLQRHLATSMAERGSSITDVYEYLKDHRMEKLDAFKLALRVFRGVPLEGGMAFTKELLYLHGLYNLLLHISDNEATIKSLWVGKISFEEHLMLSNLPVASRPGIKYFPKGLESSEVRRKLQELQFLFSSIIRPEV